MRLWPRFVRTPWQWARDCYNMAAGFVILALLFDLTAPRCRVCNKQIAPCDANYQCVHRKVRLCLKHIGSSCAP